jgi:signal transduction histidine kinase
MAPVKDDTGEVVNWIGFQQDVTGRKQRQEQLGVIDRVLRHNLRNMVNVSRLEAERIQSDASGSVAASAGKILEVTDQLIGLAEKERQITELLREEPTNVEITLYDRLQHVVSKVSSEYPDATVAIDCPDHVTVHATTQFEKALEELLTNAITHDDSSSPAVTVSVAQTEASIRIEVADTGPRIPEMERDILLDDEEQTPLYHGGGLGLWYVKLVTARSGGTITVEDNSPVGNIVGIELPR